MALEDSSLSDRILKDIHHILQTDRDLEDFCIVTVGANTNKSPVLHQEHSLGLESWCVRPIYTHIYQQILALRQPLHKGRLPSEKAPALNRHLIGALLLNPDIGTFWNMRKAMIERGHIGADLEFQLTKLVLSRKSKTHEAFAHRRWVIAKALHAGVMGGLLLHTESLVTEMAASKAPNNFHAWSHRIWSLEHIPLRANPTHQMLAQLHFSQRWIQQHVSEYSGFHFRQTLFDIVLKTPALSTLRTDFLHTFYDACGFSESEMAHCDLAHVLLGAQEGVADDEEELNYIVYFCLLVIELVSVIKELNETFPGHEAIWYHRRFVVFKLMWALHKYHGYAWRERVRIDDAHVMRALTDENITRMGGASVAVVRRCETRVEATLLYRLVVECEKRMLEEGKGVKCAQQREWAERHEQWLRLVLGVEL